MKQGAGLIGGVIAIIIIIAAGVVWQMDGSKEDGNRVADGDVIKIGLISPLSGDSATYGEGIQRGAELALSDMGLEGKVELIIKDTKCDGNAAAAATEKLITEDGVIAIIGEMCSGGSLGAMPVADSHGVVLISPGSTSPALSGSSPYFFRTIPSDAFQGDYGAQLMRDAGYQRLAIFYSDEPYGIGFKDVLEKSFTEKGGVVVATESFERTTTDLRRQLTRIRTQRPDVLYIISNSTVSSAAIIRQVRDLRLQPAFYGSETLKDPALIADLQEEAEGLTITTVSSGTPYFMERHVELFEMPAGIYTAQAYDAFTALGKAIQQGARSSEEIRQALEDIAFDGVSGYIEFDSKGDVGSSYDVFMVKDGAFMLQK